MLRFVVPGNPVPAARPRVTRGRTFMPKGATEHLECIRYYAADACSVRFPKGTAVRVRVDFYQSNALRMDIDNLAKLVLDGMLPMVHRATGTVGWPGVFDDDSQVTELVARKLRDTESPRTEVEVEAA